MRRAYQRTYYTTITANVRREDQERFRAACQANGTTVHAVLKRLAAQYTAETEARLGEASASQA